MGHGYRYGFIVYIKIDDITDRDCLKEKIKR